MAYEIILAPSLETGIHQKCECPNPHHHHYSCPQILPSLNLYLSGLCHFYTGIVIIRGHTVISSCLRSNTAPCPILPYVITTKHAPCLTQSHPGLYGCCRTHSAPLHPPPSLALQSSAEQFTVLWSFLHILPPQSTLLTSRWASLHDPLLSGYLSIVLPCLQ